MAYKRLGELLVAAGTITEQELERGLALQKGTKDRLGTVLIANNIITEEKLIEALQMQLGIEYIDLSKINILSVPQQTYAGHKGFPHTLSIDRNPVLLRFDKPVFTAADSDQLCIFIDDRNLQAGCSHINEPENGFQFTLSY